MVPAGCHHTRNNQWLVFIGKERLEWELTDRTPGFLSWHHLTAWLLRVCDFPALCLSFLIHEMGHAVSPQGLGRTRVISAFDVQRLVGFVALFPLVAHGGLPGLR